MRCVEFVGLPGAGKTTLLRRWNPDVGFLTLYQLIRRERKRAAATHHRPRLAQLLPDALKLRVLRGPEPDVFDAGNVLARHVSLHELVSARARGVGDEAQRAIAVHMVLDACARHGYAHRVGGPGEGMVLDEGLIQRLAFLFAVSGTRDGTDVPALPDLPHVDGLVVFDVSLDEAVARVRARATDPALGTSEFQATQTMPAMSAALERLIGAFGSMGVPVLVVDATTPPAQTLPEVRRFLAELR